MRTGEGRTVYERKRQKILGSSIPFNLTRLDIV
ncbi:hypothetical protein [Leptothermofonsia sp. ETS-13]